jgi:protein required for attachment to host cells
MPKLPVWVLVADAQRARILARPAPDEAWIECPEEGLAIPNPRSHALGGDRAGRGQDHVGGNRQRSEAWRELQEAAKEEFARTLAGRLEQAAAQHRFGRLLVIAPPRFLGRLREALGHRTRDLLRGTIDKDLIHSPVREIVAHLPAFRPA